MSLNLKWYWKVEAWIKAICLILVYGLENAELKVNAEREKVKDLLKTKADIFDNHIKSLTLFYTLCALADYILDPFSQLWGDDIDG